MTPIREKHDRDICSANEWALVEMSLQSRIGTVPRSRLITKINRSRKLRQKYIDLARRQHLQSRPLRTGIPEERLNLRTRRKALLFTEALRRFETRLKQLKEIERRRQAAVHEPAARPQRKASLNVAVKSSRNVRRQVMLQSAGKKRIQSHGSARTKRRQARKDLRQGLRAQKAL